MLTKTIVRVMVVLLGWIHPMASIPAGVFSSTCFSGAKNPLAKIELFRFISVWILALVSYFYEYIFFYYFLNYFIKKLIAKLSTIAHRDRMHTWTPARQLAKPWQLIIRERAKRWQLKRGRLADNLLPPPLFIRQAVYVACKMQKPQLARASRAYIGFSQDLSFEHTRDRISSRDCDWFLRTCKHTHTLCSSSTSSLYCKNWNEYFISYNNYYEKNQNRFLHQLFGNIIFCD